MPLRRQQPCSANDSGEAIRLYSFDGANVVRAEHETDPDTSLAGPVTDVHTENKRKPASLPNIFQRILAAMSRSPLLGNANSSGNVASYGALPYEPYRDDEPTDLSGETSASGDSYNDMSTVGNPERHSLRHRKETESARNPLHHASELEHIESLRRTGYVETGDGHSSNTAFPTDDRPDGDADPIDNSPYAQVRASVNATDNLDASINTPRMWVLSMLCALIGSASNLFFSLRFPSVAITPIIALVVVHPLGRAWDRLLKSKDDPAVTYNYGDRAGPVSAQHDDVQYPWRTRLRLWLAQGQWNEKEHACVYVSSNVSFGFAFATDIIVEQSKFYKQDVSVIYQILLTISTQILGYSFAGLTRRYLVRPPSMIWPGILMSTAMFTTMHSSENKIANGWRITRWRFFVIVWSSAFVWYFMPGFLMPALSYFNVITWFAPKSAVVASLFGVRSGLGLFPVTFDWAQIAYVGSPLLTPWWAAANVAAGLVIVMWIIAPILYYRNAFFSAYLPILSSDVFDNTAKPYDVSKILTPDYHFDHEAFLKYSKVYLPITYALAYAVQFAGVTALVTHTACWHGRDIWLQTVKAFREGRNSKAASYQPLNTAGSKKVRSSESSRRSSISADESGADVKMGGEDVHNRLMQRYPDAPISWYLATFISMLAIGIFVVEYFPVYLPWYGLILALAITAVLFIPVGIVMAVTNQHSSLYLICQLICGVVFPGRPVANMVFVTYCYISSAQGVKFSSDLKLGHYMKIPPRLLFKVQMAATLLSSVTQIGVLNWMFARMPDLCHEDATDGFSCPLARVHFNGSILWGVVGPQRFFGTEGSYAPLVWGFLVGAVAPVAVWLLAQRHGSRRSMWRKVNLPVLFGSLSWIPPATGLNFSTWFLVCVLFNRAVRRRAPGWWAKYTMTLSAALDSGLAFGVVVVFFALVYPPWGARLGAAVQWWGTTVFQAGCDWVGCPLRVLGEGERFDA